MTSYVDTYCVIGSGLTGISGAYGLLRSGKKVLMLDVGFEMPEESRRQVRKLAEKPAWQWQPEETEFFFKGAAPSVDGVSEKLLFGSNFASRISEGFHRKLIDTKFYMSFARNGLGNIWGGGLLPVHKDDMKSWPIASDALEPYYSEVLKYVPLSGRHDRLEAEHPLYCRPSFHAPSRQASALLSRMERNVNVLEEEGLFFGASRLAAKFHGREEGMECQYCGMCLQGCPYGIAYSGRETLSDLLDHERFTYQSKFQVERLESTSDGVMIYGTDPATGENLEPVKVRKVFLAAGLFSTTKIMLETLKLHGRPVRILNSDQFYTPALSFRGMPAVHEERLHAMCQAFLIMRNQGISPYTLHFSVYTYNNMYERALSGLLGPAAKVMAPFTRMLLSRLYFMISYLHSDESSYLVAQLEKDAKRTLRVSSTTNPATSGIMQRARKHLLKLAPQTGLVPVMGYKGKKLPGAGNHSGGSMPMQKTPQGLATTPLGQVPGCDNIHVIDASILPSVPATSITFALMANALRITTEVGRAVIQDK